MLGECETALTSTGLPIICRTDPVMALTTWSIECSAFRDLAYANPALTFTSPTTDQTVGGPTAPQWWYRGDLTLSTHLPARHKCSFTPWPLPSTSNLYSSPVDEHMPDGGWVGGRLQSSLSPVMTTHLGFWRKNFVWFLRMDQIMAEFVSVSYCMLASWYLKKKKNSIMQVMWKSPLRWKWSHDS